MRHAALQSAPVPRATPRIEARQAASDPMLALHPSDLCHLGGGRQIVEKHDIGRAWSPLRAGNRFEDSVRFAGGAAVHPSGETEVTLNLEFGGDDPRILYHAHYALFLVDTAGAIIGCYRDSAFDVGRALTITSRRICGLSDRPAIGGIDLHIAFDALCDVDNDAPVVIRLGMVGIGPVAGVTASAPALSVPVTTATSRIRARRPTLRTRRRRTVEPSDIILSAR